MEQIIAQATQRELLAAMSTMGRGRSALTAQAGGDPFMQIIQNMVDQMLVNDGSTDDAAQGTGDQALLDQALLAGFAGMLFATPEMGLAEDGTKADAAQAQALLQQLAVQSQGAERLKTIPESVRQLLMQSMGRTEGLDGGEEAGTRSSQTTVTTGNPQRNAALPTQATQPNAQTEVLAVQTGAVQIQADLRREQRSQERMFLQALGTEKTSKEEQIQTKVVSAQGQNGEEDSLFHGQQRFGGAVAQAKQMLQGQGRKEEKTETAPLDFSQVAQKLAMPTTTTATKPQETPSTQTPSLLEQLSEGLTQELDAGKHEFTMKLKPEALGEITVKLTEKAGKMVVSITTASAQTARLLNTEMPALRETMRPMQVEVHEAVSQSAQSNQAQMQFNMSGQQFANQQRSFAWQQEQPYYAGADGNLPPEELDAEAAQRTRTPENAGLNLYV